MSSPVNKLVLIDVIFEIERNSNLQMLTWSFFKKKRTLQTFHDSKKYSPGCVEISFSIFSGFVLLRIRINQLLARNF